MADLHHAALGGDVREVKRLLDLGANIDETASFRGATPLHIAAYKGHIETVRLLLDRGAYINPAKQSG